MALYGRRLNSGYGRGADTITLLNAQFSGGSISGYYKTRFPYYRRSRSMADDKGDRGPADRARVNVNENYEVRYWCGKFSCTEAQLRAAVKAVWVMADDVQSYLRT
jgi:hypothetical protein